MFTGEILHIPWQVTEGLFFLTYNGLNKVLGYLVLAGYVQLCWAE